MYPQRLASVLPLVDWVGLDVKAPFADYPRRHRRGRQRRAGARRSAGSGGVRRCHEVRTTVHPALLADADVVGLAHDLAARGVKHYVIQAFRSQGCGDAGLCQHAARERPLQTWAGTGRAVREFSVRA